MLGTIKKIIRYFFNLMSMLIVVCSVLLMLSVLFTNTGETPKIMGYSILRVLTGSMDPEISINSLIVIKEQNVKQLQEGDVISFYSTDPALDGMINTHRITRIEKNEGKYTIYTKGDDNETEDLYPTDEKHLVGKVIWVNHFLGVVVRLAANPLVFVPIIVAPLVMILLYHLWQVVHTTKEIAKEQEQAYQEELLKIYKKKKEKEEQGKN